MKQDTDLPVDALTTDIVHQLDAALHAVMLRGKWPGAQLPWNQRRVPYREPCACKHRRSFY